ncbi:MAG: isoprenylcysteine carboxylmethyltransferase family protein [Acidobacteria bacterium]|nr:isoprenylcysteine carboxylmethyltransferase family protein [Acidobacteriota bacterium]
MASWNLKAQRLRVPAGTVLGVVFLVLMHPSRRSLWLGASIAAAGALLRLWASGHIVKGKVLTRSGPYAYCRNPLYLGSFLMALGVIIGGQGYWLLPIFALFFITFYFPVMRAEEQELLHNYADDFVQYSQKVPLFIPRFRSAGYPVSGFQWGRVMRNREHRTVIGLLLAEAVLVLEYFLR